MDDDGSAQNLATEEITSKIVLTAIIVLFVAVLLVLLLHLYAKLFWWRVNLQQQHQQQQSSVPSQSTRRQRRGFIFVPGQDALRSSGLDPSILGSLPVVVFRQEDFKDGLECSVCLSDLVNGEKARLLPKCNHGFHVDCIDMWFHSHSSCPICRNTVLGPDQAVSNPGESVSDGAVVISVNDHHAQSESQNSGSGPFPESPNFPTNVLIWGNQNQVSTGNAASVEDGAAAAGSRAQGSTVVLEIDDVPMNRSENVSSSSSSSMRFVVEEEPKSPVTTRLRSLKRFLSREKRVAAAANCSSSGAASADA